MAVPARRAPHLDRPTRPQLAPVPPGGRPNRRPRRRLRRVPFVLLCAALLAGVLLVLTSAQALVAQDAFRLTALDARAERIRVENDLLRVQVAELSTPDRIAAAARAAGLARYRELVVLDGEG
jgi:cell division protein FtsL